MKRTASELEPPLKRPTCVPPYLVGAENISDFEDIKDVFKGRDIPKSYHKSSETEKFEKMAEAVAGKNYRFTLVSWYLIAIQSMAGEVERYYGHHCNGCLLFQEAIRRRTS